MYNTSYEEYMQTVLGYTPNCMQNTMYSNDYYIVQTNNSILDELYPEMYKKIYPLICKQCNTNTMPVTKEILEQMTDNVLSQIEIDLKIQTNVKIETRKEDVKNTSQRNQTSNARQKDINIEEIDREDRNRRNNTLRDLIKILIIRELLDRGHQNKPPHFPTRPPMQGGRPPFQGGNRPPFSGGVGGIMPREF